MEEEGLDADNLEDKCIDAVLALFRELYPKKITDGHISQLGKVLRHIQYECEK